MQHLKVYSKQDILHLTTIRKFETKIGEKVQSINTQNDLQQALQASSARYVIVGVSEDIGIKGNNGLGGLNNIWLNFLKSFLNGQSNDFLQGEEVLVLGYFDFNAAATLIENTANNAQEKIDAYRHAVNIIDDEVEQLVQIITQNRKFPIVISGGQNNAYPCIKGAAKGWHKSGIIPLAQINAINLDACADYRPIEGRHSGNAFRYADEDGYLEKYCVIGIHENQIQQNVWVDMVNNPFIDCITFEDIFLHEKKTFIQAVGHATDFTDDTLCGIELDISCIKNAKNSIGISAMQARQYLHYVAFDSQPAYLHICNGEYGFNVAEIDVKDEGKLIAYLVSDFVKAMQQTNQ